MNIGVFSEQSIVLLYG